MKLKYYVYEWYDENDVVMYVGKGCNDRYKSLRSRNKIFRKYLENHSCKSRIIEHYEKEEDAYKKEFDLIKHYWSLNQCFANIDEGGKNRAVLSGYKNAQFGVSPKERMDEETYNGWISKHKQLVGTKNPNYGNRKLSKIYENDKKYALEKQSRPRGQNGRAMKVALYNNNKSYIGEFNCIPDCVDHLKITLNVNCNSTSIYSKFSKNKSKTIQYKKFYLERI